MSILFIVTLYNNATTIIPCLLAILRQKSKLAKEIVVVDDGSRDQSATLVAALAHQHREIKLIRQKHGGQAKALNRGLKAIRDHQYVALVEGDVVIAPRWLGQNLQKFKQKEVAAVGGMLHPLPNAPWIARLAGYEVEYKMQGQHFFPNHLTSANVIYRAEVFSRIGQFREDLFNAAFDGELNLRLLAAGYKLFLNKETHAWHDYKKTLWDFLQRTYAYARFRPYLRAAPSYPYDRVMQLQIFILALLLVGTCGFIFLPLQPFLALYLLLWILYGALNTPPVLWALATKKDTAMLIFPLLSVLRNSVAIIGLIIGFFSYHLKNKKSHEKSAPKF